MRNQNAVDTAREDTTKIGNQYKVEKIAAKDKTRGALNFALLDTTDDQAKLIVSNGHALASINVDADKLEQGLVPVNAIIESRRLSKRQTESEISLNGDCKLAIGATFERGEGQYPDWRKVMPEGEVTFKIAFNAKMLHELAGALGSADGVVSVEFIDNLRPMRVYGWPTANSGADRTNVGVLMPCRDRD